MEAGGEGRRWAAAMSICRSLRHTLRASPGPVVGLSRCCVDHNEVVREIAMASSLNDPLERLRRVAERQFPQGARIIVPPGEGEYVLLASWKLGTDAERKSKRSKTVRVALTAEAVEDYLRASAGQREYSEARFEALLRRRLVAFDPDHDSPLGHATPVDRWSIGTIELNG